LFISPALYNHERKAFWPFLLVSYPLFVGGGMFGYFAVLPFGYDFFLGFENQFTLPSLRMGAYLSLTVKLLFAFGLIFELPTIIYILARMGLVEADWLRQNRKYSLVIVFILAAILTPPDVVTQTLMAGPLIILYEISIWIAKVASPNEKKPENQSESS
jgi:sec-independent protein translocase protein TatC